MRSSAACPAGRGREALDLATDRTDVPCGCFQREPRTLPKVSAGAGPLGSPASDAEACTDQWNDVLAFIPPGDPDHADMSQAGFDGD
jgi:hypothetical protein